MNSYLPSMTLEQSVSSSNLPSMTLEQSVSSSNMTPMTLEKFVALHLPDGSIAATAQAFTMTRCASTVSVCAI